jgi:pimeloyl-ACP methyl ester carboxylesterase
MKQLGFERFDVAGHDRGGRVAYRMALDHPAQVGRLAVLDVAPGMDAWDRADARFALAFWPWSLLAQAEPLPERLLVAGAQAIVQDALEQWDTPASAFSPAVRLAYVGLEPAVIVEHRGTHVHEAELRRQARAAQPGTYGVSGTGVWKLALSMFQARMAPTA